MNIRNVSTPPIAPVESKSRAERKTRAQSSTERDGNGRQEQADPELKRHLSQQEFDDCLKALEDLPGLKANNLRIKVEVAEDHRVVLVLDSEGKVVRRLSENQLWHATRDKDRQTGRILDKAM